MMCETPNNGSEAGPRLRADARMVTVTRQKNFSALLICFVLLGLVSGCATGKRLDPPSSRRFEFHNDTFAFANELVWKYGYDEHGKWTSERSKPEPTYTLHCLVLARSARQFFDNARFDAALPKADEETYRKLIHKVIAVNPRKPLEEDKKLVIPGYADLRSFSAAEEKLLKAGCGGAWQSYFARGNWRMIFPFTRRQQAGVAQKLMAHFRPDHPLVVHLSRFPQLTINHTVLIFDARETESEIHFVVYDPNEPSQPTELVFDRKTRTFLLPSTHYFPGGRVDVYETFHKWDY